MVTQAQTIPSGEDISLDQQLININQSSVTSGIIYERVIPAANLYNFNTVSTFNTANYSYFKQALSEMHRASNGTKFISIDNLKSLVSYTTNNNEVNLAILNTEFHILNYNEDNPSQGGLTYNTFTNRFSQISGKDPFFKFHNTVVAPAKDYVSGISITYKVNNSFYFKNGSKTIKTLVADFGDGINRTLINNQVLSNQNITVNYGSSGDKISTFTITYTDNSTLTTYGKIYFHYEGGTQMKSSMMGKTLNSGTSTPCSDPSLKQDYQLQADVAFTGYEPNDPTIKAKIDYRVFYANPDKKIRKPIIIIDGFDPGDKRKIEDCDCEDIPDCAARNTTNGVFDAAKHRSMTDLMEYIDGPEKKFLLEELRSENYDVIMVNHPTYKTQNLQNGQEVTIDGGAYYIESNAMALVKLLTQTKQELVANGSNAEIAIVGPSMGGQISRYALSYMEKNNIPHNTYLWISVDSPHLGANIPMGDQALLYLLKEGGIDQAADFYDKELSSPAAQQQLIEFHRPKKEWVNIFGQQIQVDNYHQVDQNYLDAQTTSQSMPNNRGNSYFQQHYNNQNNNGLPGSGGWPQNLRKISLVNGSLTGSKATQTPIGTAYIPFADDGEKVFNLRGFQRVNIDLPWPLGSITFRIHIASLEARNMPTNASTQISRFKKGFRNRTTRSPNINTRGVMDNVPGGFFDAQADISEATSSQDPVPGVTLTSLNNWSLNNISFTNIFKSISEILGGSEWYRHEYNPIHSFIPSFSALGHLQPNQNWSNPLDENLVCKNLTPFDSYFGLERNTQHTSFTKESVDWLLAELAGNQQDPYFPFNASSLDGPALICDSGGVYTIDSCKVPGNVVNWEISSSLDLWYSDATMIVVAPKEQFTPDPAVITATFNNGQKIEKTISISTTAPEVFGQDPDPNKIYMQSDLCLVHFRDPAGLIQLNSTNFQFRGDPNDNFSDNGPNGYVVPMYCNTQAPYLNLHFEARMKNDCGWGQWYPYSYFLQGYDPNYPGGFQFSMFSSSYDADLNISIIENTEKEKNNSLTSKNSSNKVSNTITKGVYNIKIIDIYGFTKYQKSNIKNKKLRIEKRLWPTGIYYVILTDEQGESYTKGFSKE